MNTGLVRASVIAVAFTAALLFACPTTAQDESSPYFNCGKNFVTVDVNPDDAIGIQTIRKSSIWRVLFSTERGITVQFKIGDKFAVKVLCRGVARHRWRL